MAAAEALKLEVATPLGRALDTQSGSVQLPGASGELGILPGHLPLLTAIKPGLLKYSDSGTVRVAAVGGGFAEADASSVRLIAEFFMPQGDVDGEKAQKDLETAQKRLKEFSGEFGDPESVEIQRDLDWAQAQLALAATSHN